MEAENRPGIGTTSYIDQNKGKYQKMRHPRFFPNNGTILVLSFLIPTMFGIITP